MEKQNEVILKNATLENVMRYLHEKLKGINGKLIKQIHDDGTIFMYLIQNPQLSFPIPDKIEVRYTSTITPQGNLEKTYGLWQGLSAMRFEGAQLQTNTVRIKGECHHPIILSDFDRIWADMLKDFGANEPAKDDEETRIMREALIKIAGINSDATDALSGKPEKKSVKPRKTKTKGSHVPDRKAEKRKWASLWEFYEKQNYKLQRLSAKQFRIEYELYEGVNKPRWIPQDDETLQNLINEGNKGKIPKYENIK